MKKYLLILAVLVFSGCTNAKSYELDDEWLPLKEIKQRSKMAALVVPSKSNITTVSPYCYVTDLDYYLKLKPPGSVKFRSIMTHERIHAQRQEKTGVFSWVGQYMTDAKFALAEEKIGYYHQMKLDGSLRPENVASALSKYKIFTGGIVSYEDALTWARLVRSGQWHPKP
tara:strand:+ start:69466 stop:69975 length:510 start_codon:yes stop_codon:yes gene_type:complete